MARFDEIFNETRTTCAARFARERKIPRRSTHARNQFTVSCLIKIHIVPETPGSKLFSKRAVSHPRIPTGVLYRAAYAPR